MNSFGEKLTSLVFQVTLPAGNVGCLAAQFGGQLSGCEFGGVAVSGRPARDIRCPDLGALKLPFGLSDTFALMMSCPTAEGIFRMHEILGRAQASRALNGCAAWDTHRVLLAARFTTPGGLQGLVMLKMVVRDTPAPKSE